MSSRAKKPFEVPDYTWHQTKRGALQHAFAKGPGMGDMSFCGKVEFSGIDFGLEADRCVECNKYVEKLGTPQALNRALDRYRAAEAAYDEDVAKLAVLTQSMVTKRREKDTALHEVQRLQAAAARNVAAL